MGIAYSKLGNENKAMEFIMKAAEIAHKLNDKSNESRWVGSINIHLQVLEMLIMLSNTEKEH